MTISNDTVQSYDSRLRAIEAVRPDWADPFLTQYVHEMGEPDAVRFAGKIDGVEFHQWCDQIGDTFTLKGGPYVTTHTIPDLDELPMTGVAELGGTLMRISQFITLANETAIEVGMLRLSDIALIARRQGATATALLMAVGRRGAAPKEVSS
jgi:hypothetical protein